MTASSMFPVLQQHLHAWAADAQDLPDERKARLQQIATYIQARHAAREAAELVFICTHNSRRSHLGQIWAKVWADYYGIQPVHTYSGGTEATAFHPNAIQALRTQGLVIEAATEAPNPRYSVCYAHDFPSLEAWSKVYSDPTNPQRDFCAIMTCSEADEACPIVFGASQRVSLPFEDPKVSDGTPEQEQTYRERSQQIATELSYVFQLMTL